MKPSHLSLQENIRTKNTACSMLEAYDKTPILIPVGIMEDVVKSVARKLSRSSGPRGTDLEDLQGWILKSGEDSKKLCISVEIFVDWLANKTPPW